MGDLRGQFMALHTVPLSNGAVFRHAFEQPFQLQLSRNFGFGVVLVSSARAFYTVGGGGVRVWKLKPVCMSRWA
jgi:hypothetical protein